MEDILKINDTLADGWIKLDLMGLRIQDKDGNVLVWEPKFGYIVE